MAECQVGAYLFAEAEVSEHYLDPPSSVGTGGDENVLGLEVPVHDSETLQIEEHLEELGHEPVEFCVSHPEGLLHESVQRPSVGILVH